MSTTARPPGVTEVELHGIEPIPDDERTASPLDLFRVEFGGANTFATVVLGAFPVLVFGLSFWQGFLAVVVGIVVGGLILMPMALFAPITGTNNAVSSGAHFGVVGRIVGSFLSLLTAMIIRPTRPITVVTASASIVDGKPNVSASVPPTAKKNIDQLRPVSGIA
jgi:purine-cytosine permease-like protein